MDEIADHHGRCLCGGVRFETVGHLSDVWTCHCGQCRRWSGHIFAATAVSLDRLRITSDTTLDWYDSSPIASRGFCRHCGASLFWKPAGGARMAIAAGAFDDADDLVLKRHDYAEFAGDYYACDGPPPACSAALPDRLDCSCLCGAVTYSVPAPAGDVTACHCTQCRKLSGHYSASFETDEAAIDWQGRATEAVYETPGRGQRGFCARCGSSLWFRAADGAFSVEAGAVTGPTGGRLNQHIFVADKGGYYEITDGMPCADGAE